MADYTAWLDRAPGLVMGGTGPMAAENRRPWIDWIHTALLQGTAVRDYVKWDDTWREAAERVRDEHRISLPRLALDLWDVIKDEDWVLVNWNLRRWNARSGT